MSASRAEFRCSGTTKLQRALHAAHREGVWREPVAVRELLAGITDALEHTIAENEADPSRTWALRSPVYWDHFEMYLKETLLGACGGLPPEFRTTVREALESSLGHLRGRYLSAGSRENVHPQRL